MKRLMWSLTWKRRDSSAIYNDLIQVAASKMYKGNVIEEFDEFIDPGHPLSAFTTQLTGITNEHVRGAKPWCRS